MQPLTFEDCLKFNEFIFGAPIDITADGHWVAYNTQNCERYEDGADSAYSMQDEMIEMPYATVWVTNTRTGEHRNLTQDCGSSRVPKWSPQGTHLAFFSKHMGKFHLFIWDREADERRMFSLETGQTYFKVPKWTPDGRFVIFLSSYATNMLIDDESVQNETQVLRKTSQETPLAEIWDRSKKGLQQRKIEWENRALQRSQQETEDIEEYTMGLAIADTHTGKTFSLMKGYSIRNFYIAPDAAHVAVAVHADTIDSDTETPTDGYDLYVLPLSKAFSDASPTEIEPIVRNIPLGYQAGTVSWAPNSKYLAYTTEGDHESGDAYTLNVETGVVRNLTEHFRVELGHNYQPPLWTADGATLLCIADGNLWKVSLDSGEIRNLTDNCEFYAQYIFYPREWYTPWTVDNAITLKVSERKWNSHSFYRVNLTDNTITLLREENKHRSIHAASWYKDVAEETGEFIYVVESNEEPRNIWISDANFESPRRITDVNPHLRNIDFGSCEIIRWTLEDGQRGRGVLVLPAEASEENPAPMIVRLARGKPSGYINSFNFQKRGVEDFHTGMLVSRGYAVLLPNFFAEEIEPYKQFSNLLLPGLDAAIATKKVDAERLGIIGDNFGGYAVNVLITQTTRFKAAVASASISNLISAYLANIELGAGYYQAAGQNEMGSPWEFTQRYIDGSPIFHLDKVETPLLLIHEAQGSVPFEQAQEMFSGLAHLEKEVALVKYKQTDDLSGLRSNERLTDYWERVLNWFDEYLK